MKSTRFLDEVQRIFRIVFVQKAVIMLLRAAWLGGAAYLFCWGANQLWGWFPDQGSWLFYAGLVSVLVLGSVLLKRKPTRGFVWRLDRAFSLRQQIYTAYEILSETGAEQAEKDPGMAELLDSEAVSRLPLIRRELADRGWQFRREFESTIVILILLLIVYLSSVGDISRLNSGFGSGILPLLGRDPTAAEVFSSGIPGETGQDAPSEGAGGQTAVNTQPGDLDLTPQEFEAVSRVLEQLGENLEGQSATQDLGEALKNQDFQQAADQFAATAEEIENFSAETRQDLANKFLETSVQMQSIGQPEFGADFSEATASLLGENPSEMAEDLDDLAELMGRLAEYRSDQTSASLEEDQILIGQQPLDQPGGDVSGLDAFGGEQNFTSVPSEGSAAGPGTTSGAVDFVMPYDSMIGEGVWLPYDISWDDTDVVSSYFSPR